MRQRSRKALGCFALLAYIGVYAIVAATIGAALAPALPAWGELIYYAVAGVIWVLPLKRLFVWTNRRD